MLNIDLNVIYNRPKLPFIFSTKFNLKILIDSGASHSIINPLVANKHFTNFQFTKHSTLTSMKNRTTIDKAIRYPILEEFGIRYKFDFLIADWHDHFDALIGNADFEKLKALINYNNFSLIIAGVSIPFHQEINLKKFSPLTQEVSDKIILPVNISEGSVVIPEINFHNVTVPSSIAISRNGFVTIPVEPYEKSIIKINKPVEVLPVNHFYSGKPEINSYDINKTDFRERLRLENLNAEEKEKIINLCWKYRYIIYNEETKLTFSNAVKHKIRTTDDEPVYTKSYRYPYALKNEIQSQIKKLLDNDIIRPSISPYSSPVWIVPKKIDSTGEKKWRLVIDYRNLNKKTIEDKYPLPRVDEILDNLGKCTYFSTLDLAQGFHQIELESGSIEKTAFTVNNGHYEYLRVPFGLKNAPSTFQRVMDNIFKEYLYKFCFVYMDDIVVFSKSLHEHLIHIEKIFLKLQQFHLKIQLEKCEFLRKEVQFLGHVITPHGIKPNPTKIISIQNYPLPKTTREIKSFLGLTGYYRRFIKDFARIVQPFTKCLRKNSKIDITDPLYIEAFAKCKDLLTNAPILIYPDFEKTFHLTTDASGTAIGAVLSQNSKPIAFYSRSLNTAERNYSTIERELLAIVESTKHFRPYLYGRYFIIETDHKPLVWLFSIKDPNSRLTKWRLKLEEFNYDVHYKKGKENQVADALSRIDINSNEVDDSDNLSIIANIDDNEERVTDDDNSDITSHNRENDDQLTEGTQHTSLENPVFCLPISENSLNLFSNRIVLNKGDQYNVKLTRPFDKFNLNATVRAGQEEEGLKKFIKENILPNKLYGIYFVDKDLELPFTQLCQTNFNDNLRMVKSNLLCTDVLNLSEQYKIVEDYHSHNHNGITETTNNLKNRFYWPKMQTTISKVINECETCKLSKYERNPYKTPQLGPLLATKPFEVIHIDTFSFDNAKFLTIIDLFSKYAQAYHVNDLTGISVLNKLRHFFAHHNFPTRIVCDEGKEFKNNVVQEYCKLFKIDLHFTTNYNPNSNSPIERFHSTILEKLRITKQKNSTDTPQDLMITSILIYNQTIHSATGFTPFTLLYGPYDKINAHEIDLGLTIYQEFNNKRKNEILPFFQLLYHKQLEKKTEELTKTNNKNLDDGNDNLEPIIFARRQKIRKADPVFDKINVTDVNDRHRIEGIRDTTRRPVNINKRKIKRLRKPFPLQDSGTDRRDQPGPSSRAD